MSRTLRRISISLVGGCFGALVSYALMWYLGAHGVPKHFGVSMSPGWSLQQLYPRLIRGGAWGLIFLLPFWTGGFWVGVVSRGVLLSLIPSMVQLFYVYPVLLGKGQMGLALGRLAPVFIIFYMAVWGFCSALWIYLAKGDS